MSVANPKVDPDITDIDLEEICDEYGLDPKLTELVTTQKTFNESNFWGIFGEEYPSGPPPESPINERDRFTNVIDGIKKIIREREGAELTPPAEATQAEPATPASGIIRDNKDSGVNAEFKDDDLIKYKKRGKEVIIDHEKTAERMNEYLGMLTHRKASSVVMCVTRNYMHRQGVATPIDMEELTESIIPELFDSRGESYESIQTINGIAKMMLKKCTKFTEYVDDNPKNGYFWDGDRRILNFLNGLLFLDTMKFIPHSEYLYYSKHQIQCNYDPAARPPRLYAEWLATSLDRDPKRIISLVEFLAQCLNPNLWLGRKYDFRGRTHAGKSTTFDIVKALFGVERVTGETEAQLVEKHGAFYLAFQYISIVDDEGEYKPNQEGRDRLKMIYKHESFLVNVKGKQKKVNVKSRAIFASASNYEPKVNEDGAMTARKIYIPFNNSFPDNPVSLSEELCKPENLSGIVNAIIPICRRLYHTKKPQYPQSLDEAILLIARLQKAFDGFEQLITFQRGKYIGKKELRHVYDIWAAHLKKEQATKQEFNSWLRNHGVKEGGTGTKQNGKRRYQRWEGVTLNDQGEALLESNSPPAEDKPESFSK